MAITWDDETPGGETPGKKAAPKWEGSRYTIQDDPNWRTLPEGPGVKVRTLDSETGQEVQGTKAFNQFIPESAHVPLSNAPRPAPRPFVQNFLGSVGEGANRTMATLGGLPVDAMTGLINTVNLDGTNIKEPVGGSEWIKNHLLPKPYGGTGVVGTMGNVVGEALPNLAFPVGEATYFGKQALPAVKASLGSLAGSTAGAATGRIIAPNHPMVELGLSVLGGGAPAAGAIYKNTPPSSLDNWIKENLYRAIRPSNSGKNFASDIAKLEDRGVGAVKQIVYDARRRNVPPPTTLEEFGQSIEGLRQNLFTSFNRMTRETGNKGAMVDLRPLVQELYEVATNNVVADHHDDVVNYATKLMEKYSARGFYTPIEAEEAIASINRTLKGHYAGRGSGTSEEKARAMEGVAVKLRQALDATIDKYTGPGYQQLKNDYGQLRAIENDVVKRTGVHKRANKHGFFDLSDMFSASKLVTGIMKQDPASAAAGGIMLGVKQALKLGNNPDKIVEGIFKKADRWLPRTERSMGPVHRDLDFTMRPHEGEVIPVTERGMVPSGRPAPVVDGEFRSVTPIEGPRRPMLDSPRGKTPIQVPWRPANNPGGPANRMKGIQESLFDVPGGPDIEYMRQKLGEMGSSPADIQDAVRRAIIKRRGQ